MAVYLYNPHKTVMYGRTVLARMTGANWPSKYGYILDLVREGKLRVFCDRHGSSLPFEFLRKNAFFSTIVNWIEIYAWLYINGLNLLRTQVLFNRSRVRPDDSIFLFAYEHLQRFPSVDFGLADSECTKFIHMSHYFFRTTELARNLSCMKKCVLISENDLRTDSKYFSKYFGCLRAEFLRIPFAVQKRFVNYVDFAARINKCLAVGSFMTFDRAIYNEEMCDFYGSNTIHPIRKTIWENRELIRNQIECRISYINEYWKLANTQDKPTYVKRAIDLKNFIVKKIIKNWGKSDHYKSNIVDLYNSYKMVFSSDDAGDLPSIGTVEGMACGCAAIVTRTRAYSDLGLVAGTHYIEFDGSFENLLEVVSFYQEHQAQLSTIAAAGCSVVSEMLGVERVKQLFLTGLELRATGAA